MTRSRRAVKALKLKYGASTATTISGVTASTIASGVVGSASKGVAKRAGILSRTAKRTGINSAGVLQARVNRKCRLAASTKAAAASRTAVDNSRRVLLSRSCNDVKKLVGVVKRKKNKMEVCITSTATGKLMIS